jgi:hypothetical protein
MAQRVLFMVAELGSRRRSIHAVSLRRAQERWLISERTKAALAAKKARVGNPSNIQVASLLGRSVQTAAADEFVAGLMPVIEAIRTTGATTPRCISRPKPARHSVVARWLMERVVGRQQSR